MRRRWPLFLLAPLGGLFFVPGIIVVPYFPPSSPCAGRSAQLVVDGRSKHMWLCEGGRPVEEMRVGVGRGGLGKRSQGDNRTPVGEYGLGLPRPSERFHIFIPVGYPTPEQRRMGPPCQ